MAVARAQIARLVPRPRQTGPEQRGPYREAAPAAMSNQALLECRAIELGRAESVAPP
jgi:hypothetical protein